MNTNSPCLFWPYPVVYSPPIGTGRVHRLFNDESKKPSEQQRHHEYMTAIKAGATTPTAIAKELSFDIDLHALEAELRELKRQGMISALSRRGALKYAVVPVARRMTAS